MKLEEILPFSIDCEIENGVFVPLLKKGTALPARKSTIVTTISDFQQSAEIHLVRRSDDETHETLCRLLLSGLKQLPKYKSRIRITVTAGTDGLLRVTLTDCAGKTSLSQVVCMFDEQSFHCTNGIIYGKITLRKRLTQLITELTRLKGTMTGTSDPLLYEEIESALKKAFYARTNGSYHELAAMHTILGTLIGEVSSRLEGERNE
ncbi:MAG: Hsp70 family protein [Spirochaetales bacterium]|nr:Hsp70 family protein [Spirochaetales bacterium]